MIIYETLNENRYDRCNMRNQMNVKQKRKNEEELRKKEKRKRL